jgi:hypothetical protein
LSNLSSFMTLGLSGLVFIFAIGVSSVFIAANVCNFL